MPCASNIFTTITNPSITTITNFMSILPIVKSFIVCFDVNYITNSNSFNDKVCIKIGKHLLQISYYIKKSNE
jgi:hypothetical protein